MKNKLIAFISALVILLVLLFPVSAYATQTRWEKIDVSMEKLLNNGWKISGHSSSRAAVGGMGAANNYDEIIYTYLLTKNDNYITCIFLNPRAPSAEVACR
jgi:hypothetical protein